MEQIVNNTLSTKIFSSSYPSLNKYLMENGETEESRNGVTKELLNFKTELKSPYYRCVGGCKRDINIFFLLAEALWIFSGKKDVGFLSLFNKEISNYSDDGNSFHAPYGFRLRNYGVSSFIKSESGNLHANQGIDQIEEAIKMLSTDSQDRRVVMSIWDVDLDLNKKSKDIPCNDLVMMKIRNGKLHTTIANRSNDLHWGLPTNIFQFSFVSEIISEILGVSLGTQVHNSQSLHVYPNLNKIAWTMYEEFNFKQFKTEDLYDFCNPVRMTMNFESENPLERLVQVDKIINKILKLLTSLTDASDFDLKEINNFCPYFRHIYSLLSLYLKYKFSKDKTDQLREDYVSIIQTLKTSINKRMDINVLAMNFFASRIKKETSYNSQIGKL